MALEAGSQVGPYEIKQVLGSGALGTVYCAYQESLDRDIALKVLSPSLALDPELVERFRREARTAGALRHPNIVTIFDTGCLDGIHYIAMELLTGCTLNCVALPLAPADAVSVLKQLAKALGYAHQQSVVHRDLKPENALIDDGGHVTLTDFGVARVIGQASLTLGGGPIGTPEFMSPEQARGETADVRSDIYSLGVLAYYLLTNVSPFRAENTLATMYRQMHAPLPPLPNAIPAELRAWVERCCEKDPEKRFESGNAAAAALEQVSHQTPQKNPLEQVLRGDISLQEALMLHRDRENEIRAAFQREVTVMSLDVIRSSLLKAPGQTILANYTFGSFHRCVELEISRHNCTAYTWSGDGLIAIFPTADDGLGAADAILKGLPEFNRSSSGLTSSVEVRVGLHSGRVLMSDTSRLERIASSTIDLAAHFQKQAVADSALVSVTTWKQLTASWPGQLYGTVDGLEAYQIGGAVVRSDTDPLNSVGPSARSESGEDHARPLRIPPAPGSDYAVGIGAGRAATPAGPTLTAPAPPGVRPNLSWPALAMAGTTQRSAPSAAVLPLRSAHLSRIQLAKSWTALAGMAVVLQAVFTFFFWQFRLPLSPVIFWLLSLIATAKAGDDETGLGQRLRKLSVAGIVVSVTPMPGFAQVVAGAAMLASGVKSIQGRTRYMPAIAAPGYAVIERADPGSPELPDRLRVDLDEAAGAMASDLGFERRCLGIQVRYTIQDPRLWVEATAVDRESGQVLARTEIQGDISDCRGLAEDVARRLAKQIQARALAVGNPWPEQFGLMLHRGRKRDRRSGA